MAEHETIADIIAWLRLPRNGENGYLTAWRDEIADRLEAAHRREAAFHAMTCEANERLREHLQIALDADGRERGNCAKLREALEKLMDNLKIHAMIPCQSITINHAEVDAMIEDCRAALAAPPRNCDRFQTKEDAAMAFNKERSVFIPQSILWQLGEWLDWLFAPATEKEGGAK